MKRRNFLKAAASASALAACPFPLSVSASQPHLKGRLLVPGAATKVVLAGVKKGSSEDALKEAVRASAQAATDFAWLGRGDTVFIKPVVNSGNPYPATTSSSAVAAMVGLLREKGAGRVIVGDMSGVEYLRFSAQGLTGSSRKLMEDSGMAQAVLASGAELHCFEEQGWDAFYEDAPAGGSNWKRPLMMPDILKEVQHIVLMPRCARHILAGSTLGLKAAVGYWRHDTRLEYHRDAFTLQEKTAEGNTVGTLLNKQRLVVSAAEKVLATFGPDKGYVYEPDNGLIIASSSVTAHDMVSLAWLLQCRKSIPDPHKDDFLDTSTVASRVANHIVTSWLGGWAQALDSERLSKDKLDTIWDDRVLTRACEVFGGVPAITFEEAGAGVPKGLKKSLSRMVALPGVSA